jgi:hypothetical protein
LVRDILRGVFVWDGRERGRKWRWAKPLFDDGHEQINTNCRFELQRTVVSCPLRTALASAICLKFAARARVHLCASCLDLIKSAAEFILNHYNHCLLHPFGGPGIVLASREREKACATAKETLAQLDQQLSGNIAQRRSRTPTIGAAIAAFVVALRSWGSGMQLMIT